MGFKIENISCLRASNLRKRMPRVVVPPFIRYGIKLIAKNADLELFVSSNANTGDHIGTSEPVESRGRPKCYSELDVQS